MKLNRRERETELLLLPPLGFSHPADARTKREGKCEDCENWEEEMYWSKFKVVHFFSVLPNNFPYQLKFPEKLVKKCLRNELSEISVVTLKGPSGRTWTVQLMRYGSEGLYLKKGWEVFVQEHNLKQNDVLLFKYNLGSSVFDVLICKNEGSHRSSKEWLNERKRVEREPWLDVKGCHKSKGLNEGRKRVEREPSFDIVEPMRVVHPRLERQPSFEIIEPKRVHSKKKVIAISDDEEEEQVYGRVIGHPHLSNPLPDSKGKALVPVKPEEVSEDDEVTPVNPLALVLETKSGKEENEAFAQAVLICLESFVCRNTTGSKRRREPHFVVCMKRSHISAIYYMTVPVDAVRKYIAHETKRVSLEMNGETWITKYTWKIQRVNSGISGSGWMNFVEENNINIGDACLFELTTPSATTSKKLVHFKVSIFRTDEDVM
ncbi:hypothetical protein MKX01_019504 [Papaver californicum]|nr:hypothetical protein MKX01_019504 [Papaver californicum]